MKRIETTIAFNMATRVCGHLMEESTDWMGYILAKDRHNVLATFVAFVRSSGRQSENKVNNQPNPFD